MNNKISLFLSGITAATISISDASQITLNPGSLPSSQGWEYTAVNYHAGTVESDIFSTDGLVLNMNSMGQPINWLSGGASVSYRCYDVVSTAKPTTLEWTSRTLEYEYVSCYGQDYGFTAGFSDGTFKYAAGITLDKISLLDGSGFKIIPMDTTEYHTYTIETVTGLSDYNFYVDGILTASASAALNQANTLILGDGTGGANANADITSLEFTQIPEPSTTGLIGLFSGSIIFVRRLFQVA